MKLQFFLGSILTVIANGSLHAQNARDCDVQVIFSCESKCESVPGAGEISLDFDKKVGSFCRGERCDDGNMNFIDEKGRLNANPYRIFNLQNTGPNKFSVSGVLDKNGNLFGESDEIGNIVGTCK